MPSTVTNVIVFKIIYFWMDNLDDSICGKLNFLFL